MTKKKSFITKFGELLDEHRSKENDVSEHHASSRTSRFARWLPTPGNTIFTILVLGLLILTQNVWAKPLQSALNAPGPSATTINYQGRLANPDGTPVSDGVYDLKFALYDTSENGAMIWPASGTPELHQDVPVSDGLFSVGLGDGTVDGIPTTTWNGDRWLQVWVETEELSPREKIRSVPIAGMALTVPDGSVTLEKLGLGKYSFSVDESYLLKYNGPSGVQTSLDLNTCTSGNWCCNSEDTLCYLE